MGGQKLAELGLSPVEELFFCGRIARTAGFLQQRDRLLEVDALLELFRTQPAGAPVDRDTPAHRRNTGAAAWRPTAAAPARRPSGGGRERRNQSQRTKPVSPGSGHRRRAILWHECQSTKHIGTTGKRITRRKAIGHSQAFAGRSSCGCHAWRLPTEGPACQRLVASGQSPERALAANSAGLECSGRSGFRRRLAPQKLNSSTPQIIIELPTTQAASATTGNFAVAAGKAIGGQGVAKSSQMAFSAGEAGLQTSSRCLFEGLRFGNSRPDSV